MRGMGSNACSSSSRPKFETSLTENAQFEAQWYTLVTKFAVNKTGIPSTSREVTYMVLYTSGMQANRKSIPNLSYYLQPASKCLNW